MQKIVLFIEPNEHAFETPFKIGNLFTNRFIVDEDAAFELLQIYELGKCSDKISNQGNPQHKNFEEERKHKGMDLIIKIDRFVSFRIVNRNKNCLNQPHGSTSIYYYWQYYVAILYILYKIHKRNQ